MARPYSRKTKKDAVTICEMVASNLDAKCEHCDIKPSSTAYKLANAAALAVMKKLLYLDPVPRWAEAAALIRSGWMIGDDIELLPQIVTVQLIADPNCPRDQAYMLHSPVSKPSSAFVIRYETELAAAHASTDAKEAELDTYGYGGAPTEPSPEGEPGDYGADS